MTIENNGPAAAYPGPAEPGIDTGEGHGSGLEETRSEPKQAPDETAVHPDHAERPADWNPPPGNPGSDQDAQLNRDNADVRERGTKDA